MFALPPSLPVDGKSRGLAKNTPGLSLHISNKESSTLSIFPFNSAGGAESRFDSNASARARCYKICITSSTSSTTSSWEASQKGEIFHLFQLAMNSWAWPRFGFYSIEAPRATKGLFIMLHFKWKTRNFTIKYFDETWGLPSCFLASKLWFESLSRLNGARSSSSQWQCTTPCEGGETVIVSGRMVMLLMEPLWANSLPCEVICR